MTYQRNPLWKQTEVRVQQLYICFFPPSHERDPGLRTCTHPRANSHDTRASRAPFAHINAIPTNPSGVQFQFTRQFCITDSNDFQKFCSDLSLQQTCYHDQSHSVGCLRLCSDADDHFELSHDLLAAVGDSFSQQKHHSLPRFIQTLLGIKG